MREVTATAYKINELDEDAKERAIQHYRDFNTFDDFWFGGMLEMFAEDAKEKGFEINTHPVPLMNGSYRYDPNIYFSGFSNQGDGASFEADVDIEKYIKTRKLGKKFRMVLANMDEWWISATISKKTYPNYSYSGLMYATVESDFGPSGDAETDSEYERAAEREEKFENLLEELQDYIEDDARELADDFYRQLEKEYDYQTSDEQVIDALEINEIEFTEDGEPF